MTDTKKVANLNSDDLRSVAVEKINGHVRERLLFLLFSNVIRNSHRYKYLEGRYGISARRWQNVCNRVQMPGIDMLSLIIKDRPEFATWLLTGKTYDRKQIDPTLVYLQYGLDQTEEGRIDLMVEGWEERYEKMQEAIYLKKNFEANDT
jgi:hypothetical protein